MSAALPAVTARADAERVALDAIADRLAAQFPLLSRQRVVAAVRDRYAEFDGARIRDFIPVLVERGVKADLFALQRLTAG